MYESFFGFKERPFQLVPNPSYLFLSRSHEEALAHLAYAVSQGDGFVEITGEVGTGKTTLCRVFLENLDQNTEAAYIFNPKLDSVQLLKAINDELGIGSDESTVKGLTDRLNFFLMEKKSQGKKVILVIDEAQNLTKDVLEQLRLLSNLETTTTKLLQIILIGQPELADILDSYELRQLGQRITLSYHLVPLTFKETREYIRHRIRIASRKAGVRFTNGAFRTIYRYSGGTPRLINIACDRAILTAYGLNRFKITGSIAKASIRELAGRGKVRSLGLPGKKGAFVFLSIFCVALLFIAFFPFGKIYNSFFKAPEVRESVSSQAKPLRNETPGIDETLAEDQEGGDAASAEAATDADTDMAPLPGTSAELPAPAAEQTLEAFLEGMETQPSRNMALRIALELWETEAEIKEYLDKLEDTQAFFRLGAKQNGLLIYRHEGEFEMLNKLNLPAILEVYSSANISPGYITLVQTDGRKIRLRGGKDDVRVETESNEVVFYWSGVAYVPWKNFFGYSGAIPRNAPEDSIVTLKMILRDIGFEGIEMNPVYDETVQEVIEGIQEKNGLRVDGVVGPLTKIILYNQMKSLDIPHIMKE